MYSVCDISEFSLYEGVVPLVISMVLNGSHVLNSKIFHYYGQLCVDFRIFSNVSNKFNFNYSPDCNLKIYKEIKFSPM